MDFEPSSIDRLQEHVDALAIKIGPRNLGHYAALTQAATYCENELRAMGYSPRRHSYETGGKSCVNISAELPGNRRGHEIVVLGAHYDTHKDS